MANKLHLVSNPRDDDPQVRELRRRLDEFYAATGDYTAFHEPPDNSGWFRLMEPYLDRLIASASNEGRRARVLELGAGLATFTQFFADRRDHIEFHAHDVTAQNRAFLMKGADRVFIGDVSEIEGPYDLIFSTFVLEHVSTPVPFLEQVRRLLSPGGVHAIFCPRYDMPGYLCPSLRHLNRPRRALASGFLAASRVMARLDRRPRFWVNTDPALLHRPWYRDADAVHLVSRYDIEQWHRANGFAVDRLTAPYTGWRQYILVRHLTLTLACRKLAP